MEPVDLWTTRVPQRFRDQAPTFPPHKVGEGFQAHAGGWDPHERQKEMAQDSVSAEVIYPTLGLSLFGMDDAPLQEACFSAYNDWLSEYCSVAPDRLLGIAMVSTYNIEAAVQEMERSAKLGLKGALVWQTPHPDFPFSSPHYDPLWQAAQSLRMPISLHILTGHGYSKRQFERIAAGERIQGSDHYRNSVNTKHYEAANALLDIIFTGALERHPELKLVIVENEAGWLPFMLQQWDYYYNRFKSRNPMPISMMPSEYFDRQVYATFFKDAAAGHAFEWWGQDNCMWSNDFPHENSTWPNSLQVIAETLGHLPEHTLAKLLHLNAEKVYGVKTPSLKTP
jgi:predicted TIM-barrel fold metal-dependent hydrolase